MLLAVVITVVTIVLEVDMLVVLHAPEPPPTALEALCNRRSRPLLIVVVVVVVVRLK